MPAWLLVVFNSTPVAVLVNCTLTFGMTAWVESCTVPRTLPLLDCAQAGAARKTSRAKTRLVNAHFRITADLLFWRDYNNRARHATASAPCNRVILYLSLRSGH